MASGCFRGTLLARTPGTRCDVAIIKMSQIDGSVKFAKVMGGNNEERIMEITVMPMSEEVFFTVGSSGTSLTSSSTNFMQFFISKHITSTGDVLEYKTISSPNS